MCCECFWQIQKKRSLTQSGTPKPNGHNNKKLRGKSWNQLHWLDDQISFRGAKITNRRLRDFLEWKHCEFVDDLIEFRYDAIPREIVLRLGRERDREVKEKTFKRPVLVKRWNEFFWLRKNNKKNSSRFTFVLCMRTTYRSWVTEDQKNTKKMCIKTTCFLFTKNKPKINWTTNETRMGTRMCVCECEAKKANGITVNQIDIWSTRTTHSHRRNKRISEMHTNVFDQEWPPSPPLPRCYVFENGFSVQRTHIRSVWRAATRVACFQNTKTKSRPKRKCKNQNEREKKTTKQQQQLASTATHTTSATH